jgi:uncharacterized protein with HEPN domain
MRIEDILAAAEKIQSYAHDKTYEEFCASPMAMEAVFYNFTVLGEAACFVPDEIVARHPEVDWKGMRGTRHALVHEYFGADLAIIWRTIREDLPPLVARLREVLEQER